MCLTQVSRLDCARLVSHAYLARGQSVPLLLMAFFDHPKQGIPRDDVRIFVGAEAGLICRETLSVSITTLERAYSFYIRRVKNVPQCAFPVLARLDLVEKSASHVALAGYGAIETTYCAI